MLSILLNGKLRPFWFGVSVVTKILPLLLDTRGQDPESELGVWVCSPLSSGCLHLMPVIVRRALDFDRICSKRRRGGLPGKYVCKNEEIWLFAWFLNWAV